MTSSSSSKFLWDLAPLSQHRCIKDILPMKIYPYLSYRREINETDVNYTCNLQKVWDSSDSLNGNSCSLFHLYSIYNSNDQWRFFNTMECDHREKGKGKVQFLGISWNFIFLDRSFRSLTLRRNHLHSQPFKLRRDCMYILLPYGNTIFSITFCFVLCTNSLL